MTVRASVLFVMLLGCGAPQRAPEPKNATPATGPRCADSQTGCAEVSSVARSQTTTDQRQSFTCESAEETCLAQSSLRACAHTATCYFRGENYHPLDHLKSFRYASQACDAQIPDGCAVLGLHYQDGIGTDWAPRKALAAYNKGCALGSGASCYNLFTMHQAAHGVPYQPDKAKAFRQQAVAAWKKECATDAQWCGSYAHELAQQTPIASHNLKGFLSLYERACAAHNTHSCGEAERLRFVDGRITQGEFVKRLDRLCSSGQGSACVTASGIFLHGTYGIPVDPQRGLALLEAACQSGDRFGCQQLANQHALGPHARRDMQAARAYHDRACDRGLSDSCMSNAMRSHHAGDAKQAGLYATRACNMGEREACMLLSNLLISGQGMAKNLKAAVQRLRQACSMGHVDGCVILLQGNDTEEIQLPPAFARKVHELACKEGVQRSCKKAAKD